MRSCSRSSSIRTSPTPSSTADTDGPHPLGADDPRHRDDVVAAHHEGPALAVGARNLGVDEHVLDLLRPPREPVAGPPAAYCKPWDVGLDPPPSPFHLPVERDRPALEPEAVVLAHRLDAAA